jgi:GAF domain-containing protein
VIGVIQAINKLDGTFSPDDQSVLELLAAHGGVALKNSVLSETSIAITHKLNSILEAANELFRSRNLVEAVTITEKRLHLLTRA